jgi:hypothetical protein
MTKLYEGGNSRDWKIFKGGRNENLSGEYLGTLTGWPRTESLDNGIDMVLVAQKGNQVTIATPDADQVIVATLTDNGGQFEITDLARKFKASGNLEERPTTKSLILNWQFEDGSAGSWRAGVHDTVWYIDATGVYSVQITNWNPQTFPRNGFKLKLLDRSGRTNETPSMYIEGSSENGSIEITGTKVQMRRILFDFHSNIRGVDGSGEWFMNDDLSIEGKGEPSTGGSKGTWKMIKEE